MIVNKIVFQEIWINQTYVGRIPFEVDPHFRFLRWKDDGIKNRSACRTVFFQWKRVSTGTERFPPDAWTSPPKERHPFRWTGAACALNCWESFIPIFLCCPVESCVLRKSFMRASTLLEFWPMPQPSTARLGTSGAASAPPPFAKTTPSTITSSAEGSSWKSSPQSESPMQ